MITMKITLDDDLLKMVGDLPVNVLNKCVAPAALEMGDLVMARARHLAPSGRSGQGKAGGIPPRDRMMPDARAKFGEHDSGQHLAKKFWRSSRGGILFVGMDRDLGKKMHFRLPVRKLQRRVFYWGRDAQKMEPLENPHFLQRAEMETRAAALMVFKKRFVEKFKELKLG